MNQITFITSMDSIILFPFVFLLSNLPYVMMVSHGQGGLLLRESDASFNDSFRYSAQNLWGMFGENNVCLTGKSQSPINLSGSNVGNQTLQIEFNQQWYNEQEVELINTGHTAEAEFGKKGVPRIQVNGKQVYIIQQLHFHFGRNDSEGTEHALNGKRFSLEMHLVFKNKKFSAFSDALGKKNGVLVMAVLFSTSQTKTFPQLDFLIDNLPKIKEAESNFETSIEKLSDLLPKIVTFPNAFTYTGSLTTPPCSQQVTWVVFTTLNEIGKHQIQLLRTSIQDDQGKLLTYNFRKLQPLNGRKLGTANVNFKS